MAACVWRCMSTFARAREGLLGEMKESSVGSMACDRDALQRKTMPTLGRDGMRVMHGY